jgi:hypothetical protein
MALKSAVWVVWALLVPSPAVWAEAPLRERIAAGLGRTAVLRAEFTQTKTVAALTRPLVTAGSMVYARQHGVLWRIEQPYRVTYALTDAGVSEIDAAGVRRPALGEGPGLQHLSRIFRALFEPDFKALERYFTVDAAGNAGRWQMTLTPGPALRRVFRGVHLQGGRFVEQVSFDEANGDTLVIRFHNLREATGLDGEELNALRRE